LWRQGSGRLEDALAASNNLILEEARRMGHLDLHLADLGCGIGATLFHVLAGLGDRARGIGLTLSSVQAHLAESSRRSLGIRNAAFLQADFQHVPVHEKFHLIYSIEAFIHAQEPDKYLAEAARLLVPEGRLILLDDFRASSNPHAQRWLKAYEEGWHVPNMQTIREVTASARDRGLILVETHNLTSQLHLRSLPESLARSLLWVGGRLPHRHPILPSMLGSMALQQCLKAGWIEYRWMVFVKN
jgi:cyclopropane fatty-acyl-phospholipid synthase-like methyltransferase